MISSIEALFICVLFFIITKQAQDIFYNIPYAFFASIFVVLLLCDNVILIIDFFNYLTIKEIYSSPTRLLKYITEESEREIFPKREKHKEMDSKKSFDKQYFLMIEDILIYAMKINDEKVCRESIQYIYNYFSSFRRNHPKTGEITYPDYYYQFVIRISNYCILNKNDNYIPIEDVVCGPMLIGELEYRKISSQTYSVLWDLIKNAIDKGRDDLFKMYWEKSHQYKSFVLNHANKVTREEKNLYIEFHLLLGAYLYYKGNYSLIKYIFHYSNTNPQKYELFPHDSTEIFRWMAKIICPKESKYQMLYAYYPFSNSLDANDIVKTSILKYLVVLLCREYNLPNYLVIENHQSVPFSKDIKEQEEWNYFVIPYIGKVINSINLRDYFSEKQIWDLKKFFYEKIKTSLFKVYNDSLDDLEISSELSSKFYEEVKKTIRNTISLYVKSDSFDGNKESYLFYHQEPFLKKVFVNAQSVLEKEIAHNINKQFNIAYINTFLSIENKHYYLDPNDLFKSIDNLEISKPADYIIYAVSINLEYYKSLYNPNDFEFNNGKYYYKNIEIINYAHMRKDLIESLFIINKKYLPQYRFNDCEPDIVNKFKLKKDNDCELKIYYSIVDLNKDEILKNEINNYKQYALVSVYMNAEFAVKPNASMIILQKFDKLRHNQGLKNRIEDVHL